MSGVQPRVCRDDIACFEDKQITRHDGLRWNDQAMAVADDPRSRRSHRSERCHRALRSMLLEEADNGIDDDDRADGDRVNEFPEQHRDRGGAEQKPDDGTCELAHEQRQR
jgi:hypothetical protein